MLNMTYGQAKMLYELGEQLIRDDKGDLGYTTYYGRTRHRYHGKVSPNHPEPFHHWMLGSVLLLIGQIGGMAAVAREAQEAAEEVGLTEDEEDLSKV